MAKKPANRPFKLAKLPPGELSEPIFVPVWTLFDEAQDDPIERVDKKRQEKLDLLLDRYQIRRDLDPADKWYRLSMRLACEHESGFQMVYEEPQKPRRGRSRIWDVDAQLELVVRVRELCKRKGLRVGKACVHLTIDGPYWGFKDKPESLEARYHEAVREIRRRSKHFREMLRDLESRSEQKCIKKADEK
jgi:hypothetical protein